MTEHIDRFLRLQEVLHITGLSCATIYRRMKEGTFTRQTQIGPHSVAWRQSTIVKWMLDLSQSG
ncbi:helix-turn-helix transcriptional regulator [Pseudomonas moraviensis]|uniref:Prophage regulatory protein n=1 Tax=Pseudomonas moraviensis TaxID=321662 RepID=A0A7Y9VTC4_9PSED|nr:AlpA family phage regulatory protein [Pseudomonas moraviensis]NYH08187.1 prophage regulatory protein [Pseudomonas moraviensis]